MTMTDRIMDLSLIWKLAGEVFPHFGRSGIDWDGKYREFLEKLPDAETDRKHQMLLAEFINSLGDGHTDYFFSKALRDATGALPFELKYTTGGYCVKSIEKNGEGLLCGRVLSINGRDFKDILDEAFRYIYHVGDYAYPSRLSHILPFLLKPTGNELETDLGTYRFDLVPEVPSMVSRDIDCGKNYRSISTGRLEIRLYDGGKLYVKLDDFLYAGAAEEVEKALRETQPASVIIDLRENIGGMTMFGANVAQLFIPGTFSSCQKQTRSMKGLDYACASQYAGMSEEELGKFDDREGIDRCLLTAKMQWYESYTDSWGSQGVEAIFTGPVTLLTSRDTISAAEDFVAMFRSNSRATIIGLPTCGTTGTPLLRRLSCGGSIRVCSVAYRLLDGTEFIGKGIEPDILIENSIADLRRGRDAVLAYALGK